MQTTWQRQPISSFVCERHFLRIPGDPKQPDCGVVTPPPPPTCSDGVQNQGEHSIDCGGQKCKACEEVADTGYEE